MKTKRQTGVKKAFLIPTRRERTKEEETEAGGNKKADLGPAQVRERAFWNKKTYFVPQKVEENVFP